MDKQLSPARAVILTAMLILVVPACSGRPDSASAPPSTRAGGSAGPGRTPSPGPSPSTAAPPARACPVTRPNGSVPRGQTPTPGSNYHGNGTLWTDYYYPGGVLVARPEDVQQDGSIAVKVPWWRGVAGRLTIGGRRLDGPGPPLRARVPAGYGAAGFQSTMVYVPAEGCWEVTGKVGNASLTFVMKVVKAKPGP